MLGQPGQVHPGAGDGGHDLAQAVVPLMCHVLREDCVCLDVGAPLGPDGWILTLEVGVLHGEQAIGPGVSQRPQHGMAFAEEQPPPWAQQPADDVGPAADAGQPAQRADPREHQVEPTLTENPDRVVDVSFDEFHGSAGPPGQLARLGQGGRREIQPGHRRAEPGQRDGVGPDVALQMDPAQAADVPEKRAVEPHYVAEERGVRRKAGNAVVGGGRVRGRALVPAGHVYRPVVSHHAIVPCRAVRRSGRLLTRSGQQIDPDPAPPLPGGLAHLSRNRQVLPGQADGRIHGELIRAAAALLAPQTGYVTPVSRSDSCHRRRCACSSWERPVDLTDRG